MLTGQRILKRLGAAAVLMLINGCASDSTPLRGLAGAEPAPAPDFVARSRPANLDYLPVGTATPPRATPARSAEEAAAAEAELEAARARNEAQGAAARRAGATPALRPTPATNPARSATQ